MRVAPVTSSTGDVCDDDHVPLPTSTPSGRGLVIAESAPSHYDLGNPADAASAWSDWFTPYFALIAARPEIKWFHYVNYDWTKATYYQNQGWQNNDLSVNSAVAASYLAELGKAKYLHAGEKGLLKDYGKYQ